MTLCFQFLKVENFKIWITELELDKQHLEITYLHFIMIVYSFVGQNMVWLWCFEWNFLAYSTVSNLLHRPLFTKFSPQQVLVSIHKTYHICSYYHQREFSRASRFFDWNVLVLNCQMNDKLFSISELFYFFLKERGYQKVDYMILKSEIIFSINRYLYPWSRLSETVIY